LKYFTIPFCFILAYLTLLILYKKILSLIFNDSFTTNTEESECFASIVRSGKNKILISLIVIATFGVVYCKKSNTLLNNTESLTWLFSPTEEDPVLKACLIHIPRALLAIITGKLFHKFSKIRILYILMISLLLIMILRISGFFFGEDDSRMALYLSLLWGFCDMIHLGIQMIIPADCDGSPKLFWISSVLFCSGDLVRRIIGPRDQTELMAFLYLINQAIILLIYPIKASNDKKSKIKL